MLTTDPAKSKPVFTSKRGVWGANLRERGREHAARTGTGRDGWDATAGWRELLY